MCKVNSSNKFLDANHYGKFHDANHYVEIWQTLYRTFIEIQWTRSAFTWEMGEGVVRDLSSPARLLPSCFAELAQSYMANSVLD